MIRNVKSQDAQALARICKTALKHETDPLAMKQRIQELSLNDSYYIAVYEDDNNHRVLGFIQAERYNLLYAGNGWNIMALAVDPEAQRQGIGKKLLHALEEKAADDRYTFIRLNCNIIRKEAHAFYQSTRYRRMASTLPNTRRIPFFVRPATGAVAAPLTRTCAFL